MKDRGIVLIDYINRIKDFHGFNSYDFLELIFGIIPSECVDKSLVRRVSSFYNIKFCSISKRSCYVHGRIHGYIVMALCALLLSNCWREFCETVCVEDRLSTVTATLLAGILHDSWIFRYHHSPFIWLTEGLISSKIAKDLFRNIVDRGNSREDIFKRVISAIKRHPGPVKRRMPATLEGLVLSEADVLSQFTLPFNLLRLNSYEKGIISRIVTFVNKKSISNWFYNREKGLKLPPKILIPSRLRNFATAVFSQSLNIFNEFKQKTPPILLNHLYSRYGS
jgi:hypothetical protein|uniref:HD domain-containing protein n=1 Tax=candidate division CPR3 bacterium TaxID=2268181 RepID=A0A7C5URD8_UNCC3